MCLIIYQLAMENSEHKQCGRCQAQSMMYPIEISGYMQSQMPFQLKMTPARETDDWINLNASKKFDVHAAVCGDCGYTELFVDKPKDMWEKWGVGFR
jgi:ribosomal protein S27AE